VVGFFCFGLFFFFLSLGEHSNVPLKKTVVRNTLQVWKSFQCTSAHACHISVGKKLSVITRSWKRLILAAINKKREIQLKIRTTHKLPMVFEKYSSDMNRKDGDMWFWFSSSKK